MTHPYQDERNAAIEATRQAARLCQRVQRNMVTEDTLQKKDRSPVTVADFGAQALVLRHLAQQFDDDPIVGEEAADALRGDENATLRQRVIDEVRFHVPDAGDEEVLGWIDRGGDEGGKPRFWTLDPIDGTKGFLRGEQYAIALALIVDGQVQVATLGCPNLSASFAEGGEGGSLFVAVRGQGCFKVPMDADSDAADEPVKASVQTNPVQARIVESVEAAHGDHSTHDRIRESLGIAADSVRLDSQAKYGVLARGEAEVYLRMPTRKGYREAIWDQAAGSLVIEEAGGRVTDARGIPLDFTTGRRLENNRGVIATNGVLHDQVIGTIEAVGASPTDDS